MAIPGIGKSQDVTKLAYVAYQIFTSEYKLSAEQACGIMGNMWAESGFQPSVIEHGNGIGWGLFQLSFERRPPAEKWCNAHGYKDGNNAKKVALQIKYVMEIESPQWIENGQTMKAITGIKRKKSVEDACKGWLWCWERPGVPRYDERISFARTCLKAWKSKAGEGVDGLEGLTFSGGGGEDEGPAYVSFEEALIEGFKGGKKNKPEGIAVHEILGYKSAKSAKDALQKKQTIGQGGAQFHIVCDANDAYLVVDLEKRVSHIERTNKNPLGITEPNSKIISIGMCGSDGKVMAKTAQVCAEVCHLLDLNPSTVRGSYKYDKFADPAKWKEQESNSIIGEEGDFMNLILQQGTAAAGDQDIGGIMSSTGSSGGGGRGSTKKVIEVAEEWHKINKDCYYSMAAARRKGPHKGGVDCSHFVMGCIAGAGYNVPIGNTVWMLQNCKPLSGEKNSEQCRGGKNAFFRQIKPSDARKGDILVAGGLGGAGGAGHTGLVWSDYKGAAKTKFMNSGGCSAEGKAQPNLSSIQCAMGSLGCWVFMTINKEDSDENESSEENNKSKEKKDKNLAIKKKK